MDFVFFYDACNSKFSFNSVFLVNGNQTGTYQLSQSIESLKLLRMVVRNTENPIREFEYYTPLSDVSYSNRKCVPFDWPGEDLYIKIQFTIVSNTSIRIDELRTRGWALRDFILYGYE